MAIAIQDVNSVLITGASSGLGLGLATYLAENHPKLKLALHYRSDSKLALLQQALEPYLHCVDGSERIKFYQADFSQLTQESLNDFVAQVLQGSGSINGFVHIAGSIIYKKPNATDIESMQAIFNSHMFSFHGITTLLHRKKPKATFLNVVAISSMITMLESEHYALYAYALAKRGLDRSLISLAHFYGKNNTLINGIRLASCGHSSESIGCSLEELASLVAEQGQTQGLIPIEETNKRISELLMHPDPYMQGQFLTLNAGL